MEEGEEEGGGAHSVGPSSALVMHSAMANSAISDVARPYSPRCKATKVRQYIDPSRYRGTMDDTEMPGNSNIEDGFTAE